MGNRLLPASRGRRHLPFVVASSITIAASTVLAVVSVYETGEFYNEAGPVTRGVYSNDVFVRTLSLGQRTLNANDGGLGNGAAARVYRASSETGAFELVTDDALAAPGSPVFFGLGRDVDAANARTALDVLSGYSLARMLATDGSARIRIDVVASAPQRDNDPDNDDPSPELILVGTLRDHGLTVTPILGGEIDDPILGQPVEVLSARAAEGATGIGILIAASDKPMSIDILGFDLSGDFGMTPDQKLTGFRLEIADGSTGMFKGWFTGVNQDVMPSEFDEDAFKQVLAGSLDGSRDDSGYFPAGAPAPYGYNDGLYPGPGGFAGGDAGWVTAPPPPVTTTTGGGGGGGGGGISPGPPPPPPVPAPAGIIVLLTGLACLGRRRR